MHFLFLACHDDDVLFLYDKVGIGVGVEVFGGSKDAQHDAAALLADA